MAPVPKILGLKGARLTAEWLAGRDASTVVEDVRLSLDPHHLFFQSGTSKQPLGSALPPTKPQQTRREHPRAMQESRAGSSGSGGGGCGGGGGGGGGEWWW